MLRCGCLSFLSLIIARLDKTINNNEDQWDRIKYGDEFVGDGEYEDEKLGNLLAERKRPKKYEPSAQRREYF